MTQKVFQYGDTRLPRIPDKHILDRFLEGGSNIRVFNIIMATNV